MLTTIEATYDNGQIIWDEQPPHEKKGRVLVTFLEETSESTPSNIIRFGSMKGLIQISDDFNDPLEDLNEYMY